MANKWLTKSAGFEQQNLLDINVNYTLGFHLCGQVVLRQTYLQENGARP